MFRKSFLVMSSVAAIVCGGLWIGSLIHPFAIVRYWNRDIGYQYLVASKLSVFTTWTSWCDPAAITSPLPTNRVVFLRELSVQREGRNRSDSDDFGQEFPREDFDRTRSKATLNVRATEISWVVGISNGRVGFSSYNRQSPLPWLYNRIDQIALAPLWALAALFAYAPIAAFVRGPLRRFRRRKRGVCVPCGYNLTGNVSGVCPECGNQT